MSASRTYVCIRESLHACMHLYSYTHISAIVCTNVCVCMCVYAVEVLFGPTCLRERLRQLLINCASRQYLYVCGCLYILHYVRARKCIFVGASSQHGGRVQVS